MEKELKKTRIITEHGEIKRIAKIFGLCQLTVRKALRGDSSVREYSKIRKFAIDRGATEVQPISN